MTCIGDTAVLCVLSKIMAHKRVGELMREKEDYRDAAECELEKVVQLSEAIKTTCGHAKELVHYARLDRADDDESYEERDALEAKYPDLTAEVQVEAEDSQYAHGFNCALLAVSRLIDTILGGDSDMTVSDRVKSALQMWPNIDT
jgi:hypothetical protein